MPMEKYQSKVGTTPKARSPLAEQRRRLFRQFVDRHADQIDNVNHWALMAGLPNANAIYNFLNGHSAALSMDTLEKLLAVVPGATIGELSGSRSELTARVRCVLADVPAALGRWRDALTQAAGQGQLAQLPVPDGVSAHLGVRVDDEHAVGFGLAAGSFALVADLMMEPARIEDGALVLVRRVRGRPARLETTVRRFRGEQRGPGSRPRLVMGTLPSEAAASVDLPKWPAGRETFEVNGDRFEIVGRVTWMCCAPAPVA